MNSYIIITGGRVDLQSLKGIMDRHMGDYSEDHMDDSTVIAVDKGLEVCNKIGIVPDVIVGDFDSASSVVVGVYRKMADKKGSIKFIDLDTHKDFTDTHVALIYAMDNGATDIYIAGATGTRMGTRMWKDLFPRLLRVTRFPMTRARADAGCRCCASGKKKSCPSARKRANKHRGGAQWLPLSCVSQRNFYLLKRRRSP